MHELREMTRERMLKFYPRALDMALGHYRRVAHRPEKDYQDIKKQQEACKVSIVHIQLLLKLGKELVDEGKAMDKGAMEQEDLQVLIKNAQAEIGGN